MSSSQQFHSVDWSLVCDRPLTDLLFGRLESMRTERVEASAVSTRCWHFDAEVVEVDVEKTCTERRQQGEETSFSSFKTEDQLQQLHTEAVNHSVTVMIISRWGESGGQVSRWAVSRWAGEQVSGEQVAGEQVSGEQVSRWAVSRWAGEQWAGEQVSSEQVSRWAVSCFRRTGRKNSECRFHLGASQHYVTSDVTCILPRWLAAIDFSLHF